MLNPVLEPNLAQEKDRKERRIKQPSSVIPAGGIHHNLTQWHRKTALDLLILLACFEISLFGWRSTNVVVESYPCARLWLWRESAASGPLAATCPIRATHTYPKYNHRITNTRHLNKNPYIPLPSLGNLTRSSTLRSTHFANTKATRKCPPKGEASPTLV